jgi:putative transposase
MVMGYDPEVHHRLSIRLKGFDYSRAGAYFVTICAQGRECLFGAIEIGEMVLNDVGVIVQAVWGDLINHVPGIDLGDFVIMPNHVHGIVLLVGAGSKPARFAVEDIGADVPDKPRAGLEPAPTPRCGLPEIVRQFKTFSARRINAIRYAPGVPVWQRNYYEHVIRDEDNYRRITEYIVTNPCRWEEDSLHPNATVGAGSKPARL